MYCLETIFHLHLLLYIPEHAEALNIFLPVQHIQLNVQKRLPGTAHGEILMTFCALIQRFSTFVRPRPGKFFLHKTRAQYN
jgi:hypothetical protein